MTRQELEERIQVVEEAVKTQRVIVQNCTARKPSIREANFLDELLADLQYLYDIRDEYEPKDYH